MAPTYSPSSSATLTCTVPMSQLSIRNATGIQLKSWDVMYRMVTVVTTAVQCIGNLLGESILRVLITREKTFFFFSFVSM